MPLKYISDEITSVNADAFLKAAGLAFGSTPFDLIVRYNIGCHNYDVIKINEKLKKNNPPLLGSGQKI